MTDISNSDDLIDLRAVIARFEELEFQRDDDASEFSEADEAEMMSLLALLEGCKGNGGDEEWRDAWYPITLIRDSYFKDYAQELAEDIGAINSNATWPNNCIDWEQAARELQMDYTTVKFEGVTYWCR